MAGPRCPRWGVRTHHEPCEAPAVRVPDGVGSPPSRLCGPLLPAGLHGCPEGQGPTQWLWGPARGQGPQGDGGVGEGHQAVPICENRVRLGHSRGSLASAQCWAPTAILPGQPVGASGWGLGLQGRAGGTPCLPGCGAGPRLRSLRDLRWDVQSQTLPSPRWEPASAHCPAHAAQPRNMSVSVSQRTEGASTRCTHNRPAPLPADTGPRRPPDARLSGGPAPSEEPKVLCICIRNSIRNSRSRPSPPAADARETAGGVDAAARGLGPGAGAPPATPGTQLNFSPI